MTEDQSMRTLHLALIGTLFIHSFAELHSAERVVNFRGDREGFFANAKPSALTYDPETGDHIRWMTATPNWGYGHPLIVGNQVIVVDEPGWEHDFPVISSYDLHSGKQLWLTEINHLPALGLDQAEQEKVARTLSQLWANFRQAYSFCARGYEKKLTEAEKNEVWSWLQQVDPDTWNKQNSEYKERKRQQNFRKFFEGKQKKGYGALRGWSFGHVGLRSFAKDMRKDFSPKYGLVTECFYGYGAAREGVAFPAAVSDGKHIYWGGLWGSRACLNLDGTIKWLVWQAHPAKKGAGAYGHWDAICRTPILWNKQLIFDNFKQVEAYDCASGAFLWAVPANGVSAAAASSKIMTVGDQDLHISSSGSIVSLQDQKLLTDNYAAPARVGMGHCEIATIDELDLLIYFPVVGQGKGSEVVAKKLSWAGSELKLDEQWRVDLNALKKGRIKVTPQFSFAVVGQQILGYNFVIDAVTGQARFRASASSRWVRACTDTHMFGLTKNGSLQVADFNGQVTISPVRQTAKDGKKHAGDLRSKAMQTTMRDRHRATFGSANPSFSYAAPLTLVDDAIILRSASYLICVGK